MNARQKKPKLTAAAAYENAHLVAQDLVERIRELVLGADVAPASCRDARRLAVARPRSPRGLGLWGRRDRLACRVGWSRVVV